MFDFYLNPLTLKALYFSTLVKAFLLHHNPRRKSANASRLAFYEKVWREAADEMGASVTVITPAYLEIALDGVVVRVTEGNGGLDDSVTLLIIADKLLTYRYLQAEGLPVPRHAGFSYNNLKPAAEFLDRSPCDCVIKPARGTGGGVGITTGIRTHRHLALAATASSLFSEDLLVEEQQQGDNYRLTYLDGELLDAFVRTLPFVIGDGKSTLGQLVEQANEERLRQGAGVSQSLLTVDMDMKRTLAKAGRSLRSVPPANERITLKTVVNENRGTDNRTITDLLHPAIVEAGARAARVTRCRLAGIDIITRDASIPLEQSGGVIIEVNGPPNFYYHYNKSDGSFPLAKHVLRRALADSGALHNPFNPASAAGRQESAR